MEERLRKELNKAHYDLTSWQVDEIMKLFSLQNKEIAERVKKMNTTTRT